MERAEIRRARPLLGTLVEIRVSAARAPAQLHGAIDAAFAAVERVQRLMSYHEPDSELSRLNRAAASRAQRVDAHTYTVLSAALRFAAASEGAFDPCVADRLEAWGYLPVGTSLDGGATWRDIDLFDRDGVRFRRPLRLDLGGIAKGYAVDLAVETLQRAGIEDIVVNAGGDVRVAGTEAQQVRIRDPHNPLLGVHTLLTLRNAALATSAAYFSRRVSACGEVSSLVDPRSRRPYLGAGSVSVRAADCMSADALTKVALFAAPELTERALARGGAQALVFSPPIPAA